MNTMSAALESLRFAVRTRPDILVGFSEAQSEQCPALDRRTQKEVQGAELADHEPVAHEREVVHFCPKCSGPSGSS